MDVDKIIVKENFQTPSYDFKKGEVFYGVYNYMSSLHRKPLPLVIVCNEFTGPYLLPKDFFELKK